MSRVVAMELWPRRSCTTLAWILDSNAQVAHPWRMPLWMPNQGNPAALKLGASGQPVGRDNSAVLAAEHQIVILPDGTRRHPLLQLSPSMLAQHRYRQLVQRRMTCYLSDPISRPVPEPPPTVMNSRPCPPETSAK